MGAYKDSFKRPTKWAFSAENQPKAPMTITTKIERIQPFMVGTDAQGRFVWEGREMPLWQMLLLKVKYVGDFSTFWMRRMMAEVWGYETEMDSMDLTPRKKYAKKKWRHPGD